LEELTEVTIEFRGGEKRLVRTQAEQKEILAKLKPWERNEIKFQKPEDIIYFVNNSKFEKNLPGVEDCLDEM
jgi:hypothetical protein